MKLLWMSAIMLLIGCAEKDIDKIKPILDPLPQAPQDDEPSRELPLCNQYCNDESNIRPKDNRYDFMSFVNFGYRGIGRCRGHAIITQQLSHLVHFDNTSKCNDDQCIDNALSKIKEALKYKAVTIKGFKHLYELSKVPVIEQYLKMRVRSISHKYSARGIEVDSRYADSREINLFYYIKDQVLSGHESYVAVKGVNIGHHALLAYDHDQNHFGEVLCVKDSNYIPKNGLECKSFFFIQNGSIYYKRADLEPRLLFIFNVMTDDLLREQKYLDRLKQYCFETATAKGLCKL
jgi:hypothetical protein